MSSIQLKARPLQRRDEDYRDTSLILVACEDRYAPKQYFEALDFLRVKVVTLTPEAEGESAAAVLNKLFQYKLDEADEQWLLHDTDHLTGQNHTPRFTEVLIEAQRRGVRVALSRPCFEVWLLLHYLHPSNVLASSNCKQIAALLKNEIPYNKTSLQPEHYPDSLKAIAYRHAKQLDEPLQDALIPASNTTRVYKLLESILLRVPSSALPQALLSLKEEIQLNHASSS